MGGDEKYRGRGEGSDTGELWSRWTSAHTVFSSGGVYVVIALRTNGKYKPITKY